MHSPDQALRTRSWPTAVEPIAVLVLGVLCFVGWSIHAGPDLNWDLLNYHLYSGLHANGERLSRDFFPASAAGYLAPYGYWPLATMIAARWPAIAVGSMMGAIHSLAVIASWYLARQLFPGNTRSDFALRLIATTLAVACALVLTEVGTSFIDITAAIPVVVGVALLVKAVSTSPSPNRDMTLSGICFGLGAALKLTSVPFAAAALLSLGLLWIVRSDVRWTTVVVFAIGTVAGFVAGYGYWGLKLWREFGSPFYPFFHSLFVSLPPATEATSSAAQVAQQSFPLTALWDWLSSLTNRHQRFVPQGLSEWVLRPLYMLDPVANVYTEVRAPDARFLGLFCIAPFAAWKARRDPVSRGLIPLLLLFFAGWFAWMATTGNGRYLMPWALITGPALVACAAVCWPRPKLTALILITMFACLQAASLWEGTQFRWDGSPWQSRYISATLPAKLTSSPATFVSFDSQSASWLSLFVHPDSRFANPGGPPPKPAPGKPADRFSETAARSDRIFAVFKFNYVERDSGEPFPTSPGNADDSAATMGLRVDTGSCLRGNLVDSTTPQRTAQIARRNEKIELMAVRGFFFCSARYEPGLRQITKHDPLIESAFANIEKACPRQFPAGGAQTFCAGKQCSRIYAAMDTELNISVDGAVTSRHFGAVQRPHLGSVLELARDASKVQCHENLGRYRPWSPGETIFAAPPSELEKVKRK